MLAGAMGLWSGVMACSTAAEPRNLQIVHGHFAFTVSGKEYPSASAACAAYLASLAAPGKHQDVGAPDDHGEFVCAIDAGLAYTLQCPPHSTSTRLADVPPHSTGRCVCDGQRIARHGASCEPRSDMGAFSRRHRSAGASAGSAPR